MDGIGLVVEGDGALAAVRSGGSALGGLFGGEHAVGGGQEVALFVIIPYGVVSDTGCDIRGLLTVGIEDETLYCSGDRGLVDLIAEAVVLFL